MTEKTLPTPEYLRKRLRYEPETGKLFWLDCDEMPNSWRARWVGKEAFTSDDGHGYRCGTIIGLPFKAHRVVWAIHFNFWPVDQIDHINGARSDNRINNLRAASNQENCCNKSMQKNNSSGITGVSMHNLTQKWSAYIKVNGKQIHLGLFKTIAEAATARSDALARHGFAKRHGAEREA